ncbi:MAG: SH3 domain-containing protein [Clostridia bacterium]|nr:SH3 domain-containing protein [Clostridia bacterium]
MRKWMGIVALTILLAIAGSSALADYGKAVVYAPSGKLHLREEPTSKSDSMGLFFTGTQVSLESDPDDNWVYVKIGREHGYMKGEYLRTGNAADRVTPRFMTGTITATNYARMRKGPSTEYQFIRNVETGERVTIMGETDEHWYYVEYKGEKGFISSSLVYAKGDSADNSDYRPVITPAPTYAPVQAWKAAYRSYILANYHDAMKYCLIYVDHDSIPELVIHTGAEAGGCQILTWHDGLMDVLQTRRLGFTYRERENLLCNSDGHMGYYYDDVYEIRNGKWHLIAYGEYDNPEGWDESQQRYICNHYVFNGQTVTEQAYLSALDRVYWRFGSREASGYVDLAGIILALSE